MNDRHVGIRTALGDAPLAAPGFQALPVGVLVCDEEGQVFDLNGPASVLLGQARERLLGVSFGALLAEGQEPAWRNALSEMRRDEGGPLRLQLCLATAPPTQSGSRWLRLIGRRVPLPASAEACLWLTLEDITAERADDQERQLEHDKQVQTRRIALSLMADAKRDRQRAEAASTAKSSFLAMMSHEIRTPMNGVVGAIDLLRQSVRDADQERLIDIARESAHSLLRILNDVLDFSKIESGQFEVEAIPYNWMRLVDGVAEMFALAIQNKRLQLLCDIEPAVGARWLRGDPVRLRQVLVNLIGNAIKFTQSLPQQPGLLRLTVGIDPDNPTQIVLSVRDNGIGISHAQRQALFQPFVQAEASTHRHFGGTGLGLAITARLVHLMGGSITCDSEVGRGSVFAVRLPAVPVPASDTNDRPSPWPDLTGLSLRLHPGHPEVHVILQRALCHCGASVLALESGEIADVDVFEDRADGIAPKAAARVCLSPRALPASTDAGVTIVGSVPFLALKVCEAIARAAGRPLRGSSSGDEVGHPPTGTASHGARPPLLGLDEAAQAGRLVLVAEDNGVNREVLQRQLNWLGYTALLVADGAQALDQLTQRQFGLLLTDCQMPLVDGFELTRTVRRRESDGQARTPIVGITAAAAQDELDRCLDAGMDDALPKPVSMERLAQTLRRWIPLPEPDSVVARPAPAPTTAPAPDEWVPAIDLDVQAHHLGTDPAMKSRVLETFAQTTPADADAVLAAARRNDPALAAQMAHKIVSAALSVGAVRLAERCRDVQSLVRSADTSRLGDAARALHAEAEAAVSAIRKAAHAK